VCVCAVHVVGCVVFHCEPMSFVIRVEEKNAFAFSDEPWEMWKLLRNIFSVAGNDTNGVMNIEVGALLGSMWERQ
jgi:hypothetical protein